MQVMPNGQVTLPEGIRARLGLRAETEVDVETEGSAARVAKARQPAGETRGQRLVRLARGSATDRAMTTDEIMAMTRGEE